MNNKNKDNKMDKMIKKIASKISELEFYDGILTEINNSCDVEEGEGLYYNGLRISENIILIKEVYDDGKTYNTEYFSYNIKNDTLKKVIDEVDDELRDFFQDEDLLDYANCFFICGVEPTKRKYAQFVHGEYDDTIVDLGICLEKNRIEKIIGNLYQCSELIDSEIYNVDHDYLNEDISRSCEEAVEIIRAAKSLLKSIDENRWDLWENDIENKHECILWYDDDYQINEKDDGTWETEHKDGIVDSYNKLKKLIEE
tara:strand:+ start:229 stop:996 length:768 start_codon:yes stop_codon:yes gene_type:complete